MAATTIAVSSGNAQVAQASTALANPIKVLVTDGSGNPVAGETVAWQVGTGASSLGSATSLTDANGIASNTWTLGASTGPQVVTASVDGLSGSPVVFTASATLITVAKVKTYLRIEIDAEDDLLADMVVRAEALIQTVVGQSLTVEDVEWKDNAQSLRLYDAPTNLILQSVPIDEDSVVVTDGNGDVVDADAYEIRQDLSMICARSFGAAPIPGPTVVFDAGPYTIACTAGLGTGSNYSRTMLPFLQMAVIDVVAMLYQQRTPGAQREGAAGTSVTYEVDEETGLPKRIARELRKLRGPVVSQTQ